jgi:molybdate transport system ATP-binding protein
MSSAEALRISLTLERPGFRLATDLHLPAQGVTAVFGPSGSGKTTLLRCVAGLERAQGVVALPEEVWQSPGQTLFKPTWQRSVGYVFQEASLFEHLDVRGNLEFGLKRVRQSATEASQTLDAAIDLLGIGHLLSRHSASLSGGERQRVAIARALASRPRLLLLDEPLASLDLARRQEVLPWLKRLHDGLGMPMIYVTHSVDEIAQLADHVVMLERGEVIASAPVTDWMVSSPVVHALGDAAGVLVEGEPVVHDSMLHGFRIGDASTILLAPGVVAAQAAPVRIRILARDVGLALSDRADNTTVNRLRGVIESVDDDRDAAWAMVRVRCGAVVLLSRVSRRALETLQLASGDCVWCEISSITLMSSLSPGRHPSGTIHSP